MRVFHISNVHVTCGRTEWWFYIHVHVCQDGARVCHMGEVVPISVFLIDGPEVDVPVGRPPAAAQSHYASIADAWNSFIAPTQAEPVRREAVRLDDSTMAVSFRFPEDAAPPPRLGAFALPALVDAASPDRPRDCSFALTAADGSRLFGTVLQLCDPSRTAAAHLRHRAAAAAGDRAAPMSVRCALADPDPSPRPSPSSRSSTSALSSHLVRVTVRTRAALE